MLLVVKSHYRSNKDAFSLNREESKTEWNKLNLGSFFHFKEQDSTVLEKNSLQST